MQRSFKILITIIAIVMIFISCRENEINLVDEVIENQPILKTIFIGQDKFQYEEYPDGTKILEGDIVLPDSFTERLNKISTDPNGSIDDLQQKREIDFTNSRVSGVAQFSTSLYVGGKVYYYINTNVPNKNRIYDAVNAWESATILDFIELSSPGSSSSSNWIRFQRTTEDRCESTIAGFQTLNTVTLSDKCSVNNVKHEIGHALGFFHEHQRIDGDEHIEIVWTKNPENKRNNYRVVNTIIYSFTLGDGFSAFMNGSFDFNSIMIYDTEQRINGTKQSVILKKGSDAIVNNSLIEKNGRDHYKRC
ncbi:MAG: M12 family metallopeptidase [Ekhidna sp.]|nr:M12 family metallopeptidase [Ekhidna sp.]